MVYPQLCEKMTESVLFVYVRLALKGVGTKSFVFFELLVTQLLSDLLKKIHSGDDVRRPLQEVS